MSMHLPIRPGYRFRLTRNVERHPHFIALAGMTGIVTEIGDEAIIARMDQPLPEGQAPENTIHWIGYRAGHGSELAPARQFLEDTAPLTDRG
jgi:hypothetical protein